MVRACERASGMPSSSHAASEAVFRAPECTARTRSSRKAPPDRSFFSTLSPGSCVLKQGPLGTMPPPSDIVKVAIEWPGANAQLLEIDQVCACRESQGCQERVRFIMVAAFRPGGPWHYKEGQQQEGGAPSSLGRLSLWFGKGFLLRSTW